MNMDEIFKVLANPVRVRILTWLKDPENNFQSECHLQEEEDRGYVCVGVIQEKAGVTQSTASHYLNMMHKAGLLSYKRVGQWTYYRRNEETLRQVADYIANEL